MVTKLSGKVVTRFRSALRRETVGRKVRVALSTKAAMDSSAFRLAVSTRERMARAPEEARRFDFVQQTIVRILRCVIRFQKPRIDRLRRIDAGLSYLC